MLLMLDHEIAIALQSASISDAYTCHGIHFESQLKRRAGWDSR
jgi:hypothetical protein